MISSRKVANGIDSHQHFWRYNRAEYGWIGPEMAVLQRDFLPSHLVSLLAAAGLTRSVAVQARQSLAETEWLLALADQFPFIQGVIGWVDLCGPNLPEQLRHFADRPKLRGVRHVLQDEPDDQFMLRPAFLRGLALLAQHSLTYDLLIFPRHLPVACDLVSRFPQQRFVLDHVAKPGIRSDGLALWDPGLRRLAGFSNVFCKVSGLVTEADWQGWQPDDFRPYLDVVFDAFGAQRVMFGSDWPVCTVAASYETVVAMVDEYIRAFSPDEQAAVWGDTARRCYGLPQ
jgi:L-fuconolactonase